LIYAAVHSVAAVPGMSLTACTALLGAAAVFWALDALLRHAGGSPRVCTTICSADEHVHTHLSSPKGSSSAYVLHGPANAAKG
jgi:hypothetical protein